jgi:hypothetical protein
MNPVLYKPGYIKTQVKGTRVYLSMFVALVGRNHRVLRRGFRTAEKAMEYSRRVYNRCMKSR